MKSLVSLRREKSPAILEITRETEYLLDILQIKPQAFAVSWNSAQLLKDLEAINNNVKKFRHNVGVGCEKE